MSDSGIEPFSMVSSFVWTAGERVFGNLDQMGDFVPQMLCCLMENNTEIINEIEKLNISRVLFEILSTDNNCNCVHTVKLCRYIVEHTNQSMTNLHSIHAMDKVGDRLSPTCLNDFCSVDWLVPPKSQKFTCVFCTNALFRLLRFFYMHMQTTLLSSTARY